MTENPSGKAIDLDIQIIGGEDIDPEDLDGKTRRLLELRTGGRTFGQPQQEEAGQA